MEDPEATALQKTMAQHYLHRFGSDDTRSNSTRAGVYLLAAAELGDSNAQQMRLGGEVHCWRLGRYSMTLENQC